MQIDVSRVEIRMAEKGLGMGDLARRMKVSQERVRAILHALNVRPATAGRLAKALRCHVEDILT
jgi:DNA-binding Xre family transcriptional regulator